MQSVRNKYMLNSYQGLRGPMCACLASKCAPPELNQLAPLIPGTNWPVGQKVSGHVRELSKGPLVLGCPRGVGLFALLHKSRQSATDDVLPWIRPTQPTIRFSCLLLLITCDLPIVSVLYDIMRTQSSVGGRSSLRPLLPGGPEPSAVDPIPIKVCIGSRAASRKNRVPPMVCYPCSRRPGLFFLTGPKRMPPHATAMYRPPTVCLSWECRLLEQ